MTIVSSLETQAPKRKRTTANTVAASTALSLQIIMAGHPNVDLTLHISPNNNDRTGTSSRSQWGYISIEELQSLDNQDYELLNPLRVTVRQVDANDFVASIGDDGLCASGATVEQSVLMLKDMLIGRLEHLERIPIESLGRQPTRQLSVLRSHIRKHA